ncbi:ERAP1-like C-terminal domain-containing protein [Streptomyces sp. M19]
MRSLSGLPDAVGRAVVWNAARDMVRDGELPPAAYLDAARAHLPHETDVAIVQGVLGFARTQVADRYLTGDARADALATLVATCRDLLRRTEDGSARAAAVGRAHLTDSATVTAELSDWLDGDTVPGGPALDPELRWRILRRLCVLGAAGPADIDAESARDTSATGREGAAQCRAALPDADAKRAAWAAMFDDDTLSAYLFTATASGFWQPEQHDLLAAYVPRYFPAAVALAARRGPPSPRPSPAPASPPRWTTRPYGWGVVPAGGDTEADAPPWRRCAAGSPTNSTTSGALRVRERQRMREAAAQGR